MACFIFFYKLPMHCFNEVTMIYGDLDLYPIECWVFPSVIVRSVVPKVDMAYKL